MVILDPNPRWCLLRQGLLRRDYKMQLDARQQDQAVGVRTWTYDDLNKATNGFTAKLGDGNFASVGYWCTAFVRSTKSLAVCQCHVSIVAVDTRSVLRSHQSMSVSGRHGLEWASTSATV
jgi:hypothetical protein